MSDIGKFFRGASVSLAAAALMAVAGAGSASASTLCSAGDPHPDGLAVSDMTFGVPGDAQVSADDCYGRFNTANSNPETELGVVNTVWGDPDFVFLDRWNEGGTNDSGDALGGVTFTLGGFAQGTDVDGFEYWEFTLSWAPETDLVVDLVFSIKGANGDDSAAIYLFGGVDLAGETDGAGSVVVKLLTSGPQGGPNAGIGQPAALSHLSAFGRISDDFPGGGGGGDIPLPATVWLFGAGLVGLGAIWRRRRR